MRSEFYLDVYPWEGGWSIEVSLNSPWNDIRNYENQSTTIATAEDANAAITIRPFGRTIRLWRK